MINFVCKKKANRCFGTSIGRVDFNADGIAIVDTEDMAMAKKIADILEATIEAPVKKAPKVEEPVKEPIKEEQSKEETAPIEDAPKVDFTKMSVKQLREYAKNNNVDIPKDVTSKSDIIALLNEVK